MHYHFLYNSKRVVDTSSNSATSHVRWPLDHVSELLAWPDVSYLARRPHLLRHLHLWIGSDAFDWKTVCSLQSWLFTAATFYFRKLRKMSGWSEKHKTNPFWRENIQCKVANVSHVETASWASSQNRLDCMLLCDDVSNLLVLSDKYSCRNPSILRSTCVLFEHTNWRMFLNTSNTIIVQLNDQISNLTFDCWTLAVEHHLWIDTLHNLWIYAFVALYLIISLQSATMPP